jgi:hypothetical protein
MSALFDRPSTTGSIPMAVREQSVLKDPERKSTTTVSHHEEKFPGHVSCSAAAGAEGIALSWSSRASKRPQAGNNASIHTGAS